MDLITAIRPMTDSTRAVPAMRHRTPSWRRGATAALVAVALIGTVLVRVPTAHAQVTGRDYDYDGLTDDTEVAIGTLYGIPDTDGDLLTDGEEFHIYHTNPLNYDGDGDGLQDGFEVKTTHSNPLLPDTDGDGVSDGQEYNAGTDPNIPNAAAAPAPADPAPAPDSGGTDQGDARPDRDGDGLYDDDETDVYGTNADIFDTDGDNVDDGEEVFNGTDPLDPNDF
jgi:hypothetical protein